MTQVYVSMQGGNKRSFEGTRAVAARVRTRIDQPPRVRQRCAPSAVPSLERAGLCQAIHGVHIPATTMVAAGVDEDRISRPVEQVAPAYCNTHSDLVDQRQRIRPESCTPRHGGQAAASYAPEQCCHVGSERIDRNRILRPQHVGDLPRVVLSLHARRHSPVP